MYDESDRNNPQDVKWNLNYASLLKLCVPVGEVAWVRVVGMTRLVPLAYP
jgi:hypothetical protein